LSGGLSAEGGFDGGGGGRGADGVAKLDRLAVFGGVLASDGFVADCTKGYDVRSIPQSTTGQE
jgi:hypothetical protein